MLKDSGHIQYKIGQQAATIDNVADCKNFDLTIGAIHFDFLCFRNNKPDLLCTEVEILTNLAAQFDQRL